MVRRRNDTVMDQCEKVLKGKKKIGETERKNVRNKTKEDDLN